MSPLPFPTTRSISAITTRSPSSNAVLESALSTARLPKSVIIILFTFTALYLLIPPLFNWVYPCQSVEELQKMVEDIMKLITANSSVSNGQNSLKNTAGGYKTRLGALQATVNNLKVQSLNEPNRMNIVLYAGFWYTIRRETHQSWVGLRKLEGEVKGTIESNSERYNPIGAPPGLVHRRAYNGNEEREL